MATYQIPQAVVPASVGMTLISETVANANSSISFSSIPGTYKQLVLAWSGINHSTTGSDFSLRFNNDSTASAYETQGLRVRGTTIDLAANQFTSLAADFSETNTIYPFGSSTNLSFSRTASAGYLIIDNYASTTKYKPVNVNFNYYNNSAFVYVSARNWSMWNNTSAITSLDIVRLSGTATISNTTNTSIRLYGVS